MKIAIYASRQGFILNADWNGDWNPVTRLETFEILLFTGCRKFVRKKSR